MNPLNIIAGGLAAIGVTAMVTGHDGVVVSTVVAALLMVAGYAIGRTPVAQGTAPASQ